MKARASATRGISGARTARSRPLDRFANHPGPAPSILGYIRRISFQAAARPWPCVNARFYGEIAFPNAGRDEPVMAVPSPILLHCETLRIMVWEAGFRLSHDLARAPLMASPSGR